MSAEQGPVEAATGGRLTDFPVEWGHPPGRQFSEERASWVRRKVGEHRALTAHRQLAARAARLMLILQRADLMRRRTP